MESKAENEISADNFAKKCDIKMGDVDTAKQSDQFLMNSELRKCEAKPSETDQLVMNSELRECAAKPLETDPYFYTRRNEFTSEIYKIEIGGLPMKFGFAQLKKLLNQKLKLNSHKIKSLGHNASWAFITFKCEDDRENALKVLNGYKWKGKILSAKKANPAADPLVKKRFLEGNESEETRKKIKSEEEDEQDNTLTDTEKVKFAVSPLWKMPYDKQLKKKEQEVKKFLFKFGSKIQHLAGTPRWLQEHKDKYKYCCQLNPIKPSPVTDAYRNKCEFNVGFSSTGEWTVGFRLTRYTAGSIVIAECDECDIIPDCMKKVAKSFQDYIRTTDKPPFNAENHTGYWRQLTVRAGKKNDQLFILVFVIMHPQRLAADELCAIKNDIEKHFRTGPGSDCGVTSLYFQPFAKKMSGEECPPEYIFGERYVYESIFDLKFRISPDAFFQVNTAAAQLLYTVIKDLINADKEETVVVDVCCGTGTIGMTLAKDVLKVLGIEMVASAIEDAKANKELNNLDNVQYVCGKAEEVLFPILASIEKENIVAIIDPPRAGIHNKVIRTLRSCNKIKSLIYVSCNPRMAMLNFEDLTRPVSNQYRGDPFIPISASPVDLFPHTNHYELVLLFERPNK
uniref:tRNA (uracil(54)-C(5))-methyltransferase n=1 Tax=Strigamia maritima TaxID=126957 RepID=T1IXD7_STRMM